VKSERPQTIKQIKKRFKDEWLAIQVTKTTKGNTPLEGILQAHTPSHDEIWDIAYELEGEIMITFTGEPVPEGWEVILLGNLPI